MEEKIKDSEVKKSLKKEVESFCEKWDVVACYVNKKYSYFFITEPEDEGLLLLADFLKDHIAISNVHKWYKPSFVKEFKQLAKKVREKYDTNTFSKKPYSAY